MEATSLCNSQIPLQKPELSHPNACFINQQQKALEHIQSFRTRLSITLSLPLKYTLPLPEARAADPPLLCAIFTFFPGTGNCRIPTRFSSSTTLPRPREEQPQMLVKAPLRVAYLSAKTKGCNMAVAQVHNDVWCSQRGWKSS
jgi:hypothetical protein